MTTLATRVLLIEDDPADAYMFRWHLKSNSRHEFDLVHVQLLEEGLEQLRRESFEVLVLDLGLPDSLGLDTFCRVHQEVPDLPIIVVSGNDDEEMALTAVREGAQDYLVKSEVTAALLVRAIRYSIERNQLHRELRSLSLTDELTGLYNRRGFQTLANQQFKQARRTNEELTLVFLDLDGLKDINDGLGHQVGDDALVEVTDLLRRSFRDTDILARVGGDEFAVLLVDVRDESHPVPLSRLEENMSAINQASDRAYPLTMSTGMAVRAPDSHGSLSDLMEEADQAMYRAKRDKKGR